MVKPAFARPSIPTPDARGIEGIIEGLADAQRRQKNPVIGVFEALERYIGEFEAALTAEEEVGARLVSFGQELLLHVRQIGYSVPSLIVFDGHLDGRDDRVRLVQHVNQLSFLLVAVPVAKNETRQPIGFVRPE
jgi:hypothetical protein